MPQTGDLYPGDIRVSLFERLRQMIDMLSDIVQGSGDCPLDGLLVKNPFRGNAFTADIVEQFLGGFPNLCNSLLVTVFHAICTPSPIMAS